MKQFYFKLPTLTFLFFIFYFTFLLIFWLFFNKFLTFLINSLSENYKIKLALIWICFNQHSNIFQLLADIDWITQVKNISVGKCSQTPKFCKCPCTCFKNFVTMNMYKGICKILEFCKFVRWTYSKNFAQISKNFVRKTKTKSQYIFKEI